VANSGFLNEAPSSSLHPYSVPLCVIAYYPLRSLQCLRSPLRPPVETASPRRQPRQPIMLCKTSPPIRLLQCQINISRRTSHQSRARVRGLRHRLCRILSKFSTTSSTLFIPTSPRLHRLTSRTFHTRMRSNSGMATCQAQASFILPLVTRSSRIQRNQPQPKSFTSEPAWPPQQRRRLVIDGLGIPANVGHGRQKKKAV